MGPSGWRQSERQPGAPDQMQSLSVATSQTGSPDGVRALIVATQSYLSGLRTDGDALLVQLQRRLEFDPSSAETWLCLGDLLAASGASTQALVAWSRAVTTAQVMGKWLGESSTPSELLDSVRRAIEQVRTRRRELYFGCYDQLRHAHGEQALVRVDRALSAHLRDGKAKPSSVHQRPRFFYFPDLPSEPFLDPLSLSWGNHLLQAFGDIRAEAMELLEQKEPLEDFIRIKDGDRVENYLGGPAPAWEAFFFYRHGVRYDTNHLRCPLTSRALESVTLCRIADHAPEICFSVLAPDTVIQPHFGVTNIRSVLHLPLLVPGGCALRVAGSPDRVWREGELVLFDDTFEHQAWNHSKQPRVILLMDCWNPGLSAVEQQALSTLIELMGSLHKAAKSVG